MILSPHLDDAVLSAWSVLTAPEEVRVVNVFTGIPPLGPVAAWDRVTGATDSRAIMAQRLAEDAEALALAGREPDNLDFLDEQYRDGPLDLAGLRAALREAVAGASALHAPANLADRADHGAVRDLALAIGREAGLTTFLFAELPYAVRLGWPHWVTGERERPDLRPDARWERLLPDAELAPHVERLSGEQANRKLRAMRTYRTQFAALDGGPVELLRNPRILPFELRWEVL